jgi:hypothetical protein
MPAETTAAGIAPVTEAARGRTVRNKKRAIERQRNQVNPSMTLHAKRRTNRKRKEPMLKNFDDMQKMGNANTEATMHSFDVVTKGTQAIATEIADYSAFIRTRHQDDGESTRCEVAG